MIDIHTLEQQLADARRAEAEQAETRARALLDREVAYRRHRLAAYDAGADRKAVQAAEARFRAAVAADPVLTALAEVHALRWQGYRNLLNWHADAARLAEIEGVEPPRPPDMLTLEPAAPGPEALLDAVTSLAVEAIRDHQQRVDDAYGEAVHGDTPVEEIVAAEQVAEQQRRHASARTLDTSWHPTPAERRRAGLK